MAYVWLVLGVLLVLVELHHLAFFALFAAIGSFAAALVAVFAPDAVAAQTGIALVVTAAGVTAVRPFVSRAFAPRRGGHVVRGVHGGIVGHEAVTLDEVGDALRNGHVRLTGERWLAVSGSGRPIGPGTPVIVTEVQGTTLVVWAVDDLELDSPVPSTRGLAAPRPATDTSDTAAGTGTSDPGTNAGTGDPGTGTGTSGDPGTGTGTETTGDPGTGTGTETTGGGGRDSSPGGRERSVDEGDAPGGAEGSRT